MTSLAWLIPAALFLGFLGVLAFMWALRSGQFEDLDGAAYRILEDDTPETADKDAARGETPPSERDESPPRDQAG
jgi:cbb3-type cytochrome oxidase maturation protein